MIEDADREVERSSTPAEVRRARQRAVDELTRQSGVLRVSGSSMLPALTEGTWVRFSDRRPRPGDVVVYRRALGDLVVHRFLGRRPGWWSIRSESDPGDPWIVTKPDAAAEFDVEVRSSAVLGTVTALRRNSSAPWRELRVTFGRRLWSLLWFVRYVLLRLFRRLV